MIAGKDSESRFCRGRRKQNFETFSDFFRNRPWHRYVNLVLHPRTARSSAKDSGTIEVSSLA